METCRLIPVQLSIATLCATTALVTFKSSTEGSSPWVTT